jgi:hypothetical protein
MFIAKLGLLRFNGPENPLKRLINELFLASQGNFSTEHLGEEIFAGCNESLSPRVYLVFGGRVAPCAKRTRLRGDMDPNRQLLLGEWCELEREFHS